ncbi:MAG: DUF1828 domain-containing protein [Thermodesulfobacteriota bacterium]
MDLQKIEQDFHEKVSGRVRILSEGMDRFRVLTPFMLQDGDHLAIILKRDGEGWVLSDEGHTCMVLASDPDKKGLQGGIGQEDIASVLLGLDIEDRAGELMVAVEDAHFGDALHTLVRGLLRITELAMPSTRD